MTIDVVVNDNGLMIRDEDSAMVSEMLNAMTLMTPYNRKALNENTSVQSSSLP